MGVRKKIGEVLIEAGLIKGEQLENALLLQKGKNKRLGKVLIELGYATEEQIATALSKQLSIPKVECEDVKITREILSLVPRETAEKKIVLPVDAKEKRLFLAMADPLDWQTIDEIAFSTGMKVSVSVSSESSIMNAIEKHYTSSEKIWDLIKKIPAYEGVEFVRGVETAEDEKVNLQSLYRLSEAPPIVKLVTMVLVDAAVSRASDVHIEPDERHVQVRYRIDGELRNMLKYPKHIHDSVISRVKIISNLDITNRRLPQDGRSLLRHEGNDVDLRVSTLPSVFGEKIVIRLLDRSAGIVTLSMLGVPEDRLKALIRIMSQPQGMLLVTGPTGSGKTTTLYAILEQLKTETKNIITIEDPVEYKLHGVTQVGVNNAIGLTFSNTLRSVLRQDPDIIMVGEIRDLDTAEIATRAALTGHLVLSTVHTNDTVSTITRLIDIGLEPFLVTSAVSGILAQRLVRKICTKCKVEAGPPEELAGLRLKPAERFYRGAGCRECQFTGYRGRIGVYELLVLDPMLKRMIAKGAPEVDLWEEAKRQGTVALFEDAWQKVIDGVTTCDEVLSKVPYRHVELVAFKEKKEEKKEEKNKVLVINAPDEENAVIRTTLEPEGYDVALLEGRDLAEDIDRENPDLIILNDDENSLELLRGIRANIRYVYVPVLALKGGDGREGETEMLKAGVKEFLRRPIDPFKLSFIVNRSVREQG